MKFLFVSLLCLASVIVHTSEATYQFIQCAEEVGGGGNGGNNDVPTFEVPVDVSPACCVGTQQLDIQNDYILGNTSLACEDTFTDKMNSETDYEFEQACTFTTFGATCSFDYNDFPCNNDVRDLCHQMGGTVVEFDIEMDCLTTGLSLRFVVANHATCIAEACTDDEILEIYKTGFAANMIVNMGMNEDPLAQDGCLPPEIKDFRADGKALHEQNTPSGGGSQHSTPTGDGNPPNGGNENPQPSKPSGGGEEGQQDVHESGYQTGQEEEVLTPNNSTLMYTFVAGLVFVIVVVFIIHAAASSSKAKIGRSSMIELSYRGEMENMTEFA